jgi:hypothetical protein
VPEAAVSAVGRKRPGQAAGAEQTPKKLVKPRKRANACAHARRTCINQYEFIRKYRCEDCGAVMMCQCDEAFARDFLNHQVGEATELKSQRRVKVTAGFKPCICSECRGLPADVAPQAEGYGNTSKIKRYYWRELFFETMQLRAEWQSAHPNASNEEMGAAWLGFHASALEKIKALHAASPKYSFAEPSQAEVLERYKVPILELKAAYAPNPTRGAVIQDGDAVISPEQFAEEALRAEGWDVMRLESQPFHVLFGVFFWRLIQDYKDPQVRMVGFAEKTEDSVTGGPGQVWAQHPSDFGSEGYSDRRQRAIARHMRDIEREDDLLWLFDYWLPYSKELRQYLWAHRERDVVRARRLVEILPRSATFSILNYLIGAYWDRYLGWPDLLINRQGDFEFVEVKSSKDKLSTNQKNWIADNHNLLHFKFRIVKILRS